MSATLYVKGFKPPDEKWRKMKAVWDSCKAAGIAPPVTVTQFFEGEEPDAYGVQVDLRKSLGVTPYREDGYEGFDIDLSKLPDKDIKIIRFFISW